MRFVQCARQGPVVEMRFLSPARSEGEACIGAANLSLTKPLSKLYPRENTVVKLIRVDFSSGGSSCAKGDPMWRGDENTCSFPVFWTDRA